MDRRTFVALGAAGALGWLQPTPHAEVQRQALPPDDVPFGETRLALSNDVRQGTVYVPKAYRHGVPIPVLVMLHGLGGSAQGVSYTFPLAEEFGVVVIAVESREETWGQGAPGFDSDGRFISAALRAVAGFLDVDRSRIAIGGHSDGATYALSMGLSYGDVFTHLLIFSEGIAVPYRKQGLPRIFVGHGISDNQMPIDRTSRRFVPLLKAEGYDVTYREYEGGHGVSRPVVREAFEWFVKKGAPSK